MTKGKNKLNFHNIHTIYMCYFTNLRENANSNRDQIPMH